MRKGILLVVFLLGGCGVMTDQGRVSKEVYRAETAQKLFDSAQKADDAFAKENPVSGVPSYCNGSVTDAQAVVCGMAQANANLSVALVNANRKASVAYASQILSTQAQERIAFKDRLMNFFGIVYSTERGSRSRSTGDGTRVVINGPNARGSGEGGASAGSQDVSLNIGNANQVSSDGRTGFANRNSTVDNHDQSEVVFEPVLEPVVDIPELPVIE